jgi:hypothetical protein
MENCQLPVPPHCQGDPRPREGALWGEHAAKPRPPGPLDCFRRPRELFVSRGPRRGLAFHHARQAGSIFMGAAVCIRLSMGACGLGKLGFGFQVRIFKTIPPSGAPFASHDAVARDSEACDWTRDVNTSVNCGVVPRCLPRSGPSPPFPGGVLTPSSCTSKPRPCAPLKLLARDAFARDPRVGDRESTDGQAVYLAILPYRMWLLHERHFHPWVQDSTAQRLPSTIVRQPPTP